jgi:hypothetical protein
MRRHLHARLAVAGAILAAAAPALVLAGCAQSSHTTSTKAGAGGDNPPSATAPPTSATTPTTPTSATTTSPASVPGLSVSPAVGSSHSVIHFAVTPSYRTGGPSQDISNALTITGPQKPGCVGVRHQGLSALPPGQQTTVSVGPAQIGGDWCPGTYSARVLVLERPKCGPGQMCPQFIRVLEAIGPVSFRISG